MRYQISKRALCNNSRAKSNAVSDTRKCDLTGCFLAENVCKQVVGGRFFLAFSGFLPRKSLRSGKSRFKRAHGGRELWVKVLFQLLDFERYDAIRGNACMVEKNQRTPMRSNTSVLHLQIKPAEVGTVRSCLHNKRGVYLEGLFHSVVAMAAYDDIYATDLLSELLLSSEC